MMRWLRALFGRPHDAPPVPPPPEIATTLAEIERIRAEQERDLREHTRAVARHRLEQAALRKQIRSGNFIAERLRGTHGGR